MQSFQVVILGVILSLTQAFQSPVHPIACSSKTIARPFGVPSSVVLHANEEEEIDIEQASMFSGSSPNDEGREVFNIPTGKKKEVKWTDNDMQANTSVELSWWAW